MPASPAYRRLPPAERRRQILAAATELIAASGFDHVPLEAFAAACGMTKAGLLHHFPSKDDLLIAVLEHRDENDTAAALVAAAVPVRDAAAARVVMTAVVHQNLGQLSLVRLYTVLAAEALDPAHPAHAYFDRRLRQSRAELADKLLHWHPNPDLAAVQLLAFLDGLQLNWLRAPDIDFLAHWESFADPFFTQIPASTSSATPPTSPSAEPT
ncbi:TetR/AcrR family transcriptional regulator [Streptomyces sp. FxanaA7]|uniref:TetR/AcrR family transcriptional regulator n=1 Tax=Streptomyces sp. FxanaA7 TaxID=1265492 RepID=UPI0005EE5220|nr:TetR/AcrR family transcriptional regulator [Streptomyces sp. FxanaA7]